MFKTSPLSLPALSGKPRLEQMVDVLGAAQARLQATPYSALRHLDCTYREGTLTLRGILPSYFLKQMAQEVVAEIEGVYRIVNEVDVSADPCWGAN